MPESSQLAQYLAVLVLGLIALGAVGGMMALSQVLGKRARRTRLKDTPYECGMIPASIGVGRFHVKFHLVALLFLLFDIEVVFLYPWAVVYRDMLGEATTRHLALGAMLAFLGVLVVGYLYALKKGAFDYD